MNASEKGNVTDSHEESYIPVITRKETARVNLKEILYIESELRLVNIQTDCRAYRFYGKIDDILQYLNGSFYRCHKSCIINLEKINRMEDGVFYFVSGMTLQVGQNNYQHTRVHYVRFLEENAKCNRSGRFG